LEPASSFGPTAKSIYEISNTTFTNNDPSNLIAKELTLTDVTFDGSRNFQADTEKLMASSVDFINTEFIINGNQANPEITLDTLEFTESKLKIENGGQMAGKRMSR